MEASFKTLDTGAIVANLVALAVLAMSGAWLADKVAVWLGDTPWVVCTVLVTVTNLALTVGVIMGLVGVVGWAFSGFASTHLFLLAVAGVVLPNVPGVALHYLGAHDICPVVERETRPAAAQRGASPPAPPRRPAEFGAAIPGRTHP